MIEWITTNWDLLLGLVAALLAVAGIVAKMTTTTKDDEVVEKVATVFTSVTGKEVSTTAATSESE